MNGTRFTAPWLTSFAQCDQADAQIDATRTSTNANEPKRLWAEAQRIPMKNTCGVPLVETLLVFTRRENLDYGYPLRGSMSLGPLITEQTRLR